MTDPIAALRAFLGEPRFRKFVLIVRERPDHAGLLFWQAEALDQLAASSGVLLPRVPSELAARLVDAIASPPTLAESALPSWLHVDSLEGSCPVQGLGTCGAWRWYFRARGESWSVAASLGGDPVDVFASSPDAFFYEEAYAFGVSSYDAGYMSLDEARFYVVRELGRLRSERGLG